MKFRTTSTLKLTLLDNGSLEVVQESINQNGFRSSPHYVYAGHFLFTFNEQETKALEEFLNDPGTNPT